MYQDQGYNLLDAVNDAMGKSYKDIHNEKVDQIAQKEDFPKDYVDRIVYTLDFAVDHKKVIDRFGRFPTRNKSPNDPPHGSIYGSLSLLR